MKTVPFPNGSRILIALLDWDGTFCDSRESIYKINQEMADYYSKMMPIKPLPSYESWLQASHPGVEACMRSLGVTDSRDSIGKFFHNLLVEQREAGLRNPLYPGTRELLEFFQEEQIPTVVISRHPHHHLERDIAAHGLLSYFHQIMGEPEDGHLEKDIVMRDVCYEFRVSHDQAFYLGDTSHDMRLARQAGVCPIAVSHGYDPASELEKEGPAHVFGSLPEFQEFLSQQLK